MSRRVELCIQVALGLVWTAGVCTFGVFLLRTHVALGAALLVVVAIVDLAAANTLLTRYVFGAVPEPVLELDSHPGSTQEKNILCP